MGAQTLTSSNPAAFVAGEQADPVPVVFNYQAQSHTACVDLTLVDSLAEVLEEMPSTMQIRVVMEIDANARQNCWMLVQGLVPEQHEELLLLFARLGVQLHSGKLPEFDFEDGSHAVVRVREGGSVTRPGMTRELTRWLVQHGHVAYLVFDYQHAPGVGLARYDLAFILRDLAHVTGPFSEEVADVLATDTTTYRQERAAGFFRKLRSWTLGRPKLDACMGNIADLFPL